MKGSVEMNIKNVVVAGGGVLGSQIAFQAAYSGFNVSIYDVNEKGLEAAKDRLEKLVPRYIKDLDAPEDKLKATVKSIQTSTNLKESVADADLVIEAVPEKLSIKQSFYKELGEVAPEKTIFATNSSTLLPSDFKDATGRKDRFLALHFANEIWLNNVGEIMATKDTDRAVFDEVVEYAGAMGLHPVPIKKEHAGYVQNSLLVPFFHVAEEMYANEEETPQEIDKIWMNAIHMNVGPFGAIDVVGLNTNTAIVQAEYEKDGTPWKKAYVDKNNVKIENGELGKATGKGFYTYPNPEYKTWDIPVGEKPSDEHLQQAVANDNNGVLSKLLLSLFKAAEDLYVNEIAEYDVIDTTWHINSRSPIGPFEMMDAIGIDKVIEIHEKYDNNIDQDVMKFLESRRGKTFYS
ncbi:3-hydroxyacyl-CoA dehydrogenase [Staphylococcus chromogenes]|uniref:3-hydroxyacyl-CoA dehydrogenase n=1 Tax=Staphylococcus chromogenes TaxID=46126 RepID=UPI0030C7500A